jgi:hypothetical protein
MYGDLVRSAEGGTLVRTYNINLSKIKPTLEYGDNITFIVITEYKIDNKTYNVSKPHTVTFLEPLQSQLDRLERLSRGYQDETDEKIKIDNKCKQLVDTNSSEIIKEIMSTEAFHNRTAEEVYQYCKLITTRPPMPPEVNITALKIRQELENRGQSEEQ